MKLYTILVAFALLFSANSYSQDLNQSKMEKNLKSKTIIFIHGLFVNNESWKEWKTLFESEGYTCYTPANPNHDGKPNKLRLNPPEGLEDVRFEDWLLNLEKLIDTLPEKPILIGHSFGGLAAQKLVELGKAEAAVLISSAPPKGTLSFKPSFWKANNKSLNFFKGRSVFNPDTEKYKKWFHYAFANTLSKEESDIAFDQFAVPESRRTHRAALKKITKVNTKKPHVPLLFLGGLDDVIVPNELVRKNIKQYKNQESIVDSKFFEGKDHFICGADGWEQVANFALGWLKN